VKLAFGVDLGGTKIEIAALDRNNEMLLRRRIPTPAGDYDATIAAIAALVGGAERDLGARASSVGIGTPGALSLETGCIKNSNSTALNGKPLKRDLETALARPVAMENDANCFVLSEAVDGAASGRRVVFGAILGTGTGGGIAVNGAILRGANAIAGEWGHNPLPWTSPDELPGPSCYCGKRGCIETYLRGDAFATADFAAYAGRLARALAGVVNVLDPDVIVLGGGISNVEEIYRVLPRLLRAHVFSDSVRTPIVRAAHGDSSGVRGAAMLSEV
jgi:fructokinase